MKRSLTIFVILFSCLLITLPSYAKKTVNLQTKVISDFGDYHDRYPGNPYMDYYQVDDKDPMELIYREKFDNEITYDRYQDNIKVNIITDYVRIRWTAEFSRFFDPTPFVPADKKVEVRQKYFEESLTRKNKYWWKPYEPYFFLYKIGRPNALSTLTVYKEKKLEIERVRERQQLCLGVRAAFTRKGFNWIEIKPKKPSSTPRKGLPPAIPLPGRVKRFDVWVWGGNYHWNLEVHLMDHYGFTHVIPVGKVNFVGWKQMSAEVPGFIPQAESHIPQLKPLLFVKFKLWSDPGERADMFYIYFDKMQVQTDMFEERFDGDTLQFDWETQDKLKALTQEEMKKANKQQ